MTMDLLLLRKRAAGGFALDFTGDVLPAGASFARASQASYFDASGVLQIAANGTARFDHDPITLASRGILIEPAATNLVLYSQNFSNAGWIAASKGANVTSPDGTGDGMGVTIGSGTSSSAFIRQNVAGWTAGTTGTMSAWVRQSASGAAADTRLTTNNQSAWNTGISGRFALSSSWARLSLSGDLVATSGISLSLLIGALDATGANDATCQGKIDIFGVQAETGAVATSYIPATSASASRAADALSFTIPAGIGHLIYTFDDGSTEEVAVGAGSYTVPTNLNRAWIKMITGAV
ncbi:MAG: hypothetical protein KGI97_03455 [Alphaproteobacteria bacterium]|nr:hypothetical protein [Alphaproteobacteria bacterium]